MHIRLHGNDMKMIYKGLLVLLSIIIIGILAAETQLNTLTKRADYVQCFNVRRTIDSYYLFLFGTSYHVSAMKNIGGFSQTDDDISYQIADKKVVIPTRIHLDIDTVLLQAIDIRQYVISESKKQKARTIVYLQQLGGYLRETTTKITRWQQELKNFLLEM